MEVSTGHANRAKRPDGEGVDLVLRNNQLLSEMLRLQLEVETYYLQVQALEDDILIKKRQNSRCKKQLRQRDQLMERAQEAVYSAHIQARRSIVNVLTRALFRLRPARLRVRAQVALISKSPFFDARWYALHNPDVALRAMNLAEHYVLHGGIEGRAPGPDFSSRKYLEKYRDVKESRQNPLVHYLTHGQPEGRKRFRPEVYE